MWVWILASAGFYTVFAFISYKHVQLGHSKNGKWEGLSPSGFDVFFVFCPIVNVIPCFDWLFNGVLKNKKRDYTKFFRVNT